MSLAPIFPVPQFLGATGAMLAGGNLYWYAAGTTTAQATYTDAALSVAHSNPITLDAQGRPPSPVHLQNLAYKLVAKDADNNTLLTWDNLQFYGSNARYTAVTGAYTALLTDDLLVVTSGGPFSITLPTAVGNQGKVFEIKILVAAQITIDPNGAETIDGATTWVLSSKQQSLVIRSDGSSWKIVSRTGRAINSYTGAHTVAVWEDTCLENGTYTVTLPLAAEMEGRRLVIKMIAAGTITIDGNGAETIDGAATYVIAVAQTAVEIESDGTAWRCVGEFVA